MSSKKPKIVHVVVAANIGGAEHFVANLASQSASTGADHCIALLTANDELRKLLGQTGLNVRDRGQLGEYPFAYFKRTFGVADVAWLTRVLAEEGATIVHAHTFGSHILSARGALRSGLPVLRTEHGVGHYRKQTRALFRHWALLNTDRIVAISEFVAGFVAILEPRVGSRIRVIPNGIDIAQFGPAPPLRTGGFTLALTSRLDPEKRVDLAIEAVACLPGVQLQIAGAGSERAKLETLARRLGVQDRVRFLGYQTDIRPVIATSHAVINCTFEEGLSLALIEAASMQRPAIAFAGGGVPEVIEDRVTGWLAREYSVESFAAAIAEASSDLNRAEAFGVRARAVALERFTLENMCKAYGDVYRELAEASERARQ